MMSARDVIASELARISRVDMSEAPRYARASVRTAALHVERALHAADYRILGLGELDAETVDRCIKELNKMPWFEDVVSLVDVEDALRALAQEGTNVTSQ